VVQPNAATPGAFSDFLAAFATPPNVPVVQAMARRM
jgi:hypothetical protein